MERKKILKLPNIFDTQKEGKGVKKGEVKDPSFKNFFASAILLKVI